MNIITIVIVLAVIGFLLWLVLKYVPMAEPFPKVITIVVIFAVVLWLLYSFGLIGGGPVIKLR